MQLWPTGRWLVTCSLLSRSDVERTESNKNQLYIYIIYTVHIYIYILTWSLVYHNKIHILSVCTAEWMGSHTCPVKERDIWLKETGIKLKGRSLDQKKLYLANLCAKAEVRSGLSGFATF